MDNLHFWTCDIMTEEQIKKISELNTVLSKIGMNISFGTKELESGTYGSFEINYDIAKTKKLLSRNAGRTRKCLEYKVTPEEVRERMQQGESAEQIAKTLGISRATLFRKLKKAEENDFDCL